MKYTLNQDADQSGTFKCAELTASYADLKAAFGHSDAGCPHEAKVFNMWTFEDEDGAVYVIHDWNENAAKLHGPATFTVAAKDRAKALDFRAFISDAINSKHLAAIASIHAVSKSVENSKKRVKGYVIDAVNREVREVELADTLQGMYDAIGCDLITSALVIENDDTIYVDDEGLFKECDAFFTFEGGHQPFAGNGVILGCGPTGESCNATVTLESVKARVKFYTRAEVRALIERMEG